MAEVKWIKINVDMFDDEKIKIIQSMPDGDALLVVWIKLITLAGKTNDGGYIYIAENMPYTDEMLSVIMNKPLNTIRLALDTFTKLGMIEIDVRGIYLVNFDKHQSLDRMEKIKEQNRIRKQRQREREKEKLLGYGKCAYCGDEGSTTDHVIPTSKGGLNIKENLVCCCLNCNLQKNNHDVAKFLNDRLIMNEKVDIEGIVNNDILKKYITFDYKTQQFVSRDVTQSVTQSHATDIDIDIDKDIDKEKDIKKKNTTTKHKYGEYKHVLLSDNEYKKLEEQYGSSSLQSIITYLDEYLEMKGTKYKSHYMVIKKWGAEAALKKEREQRATFFKSFLES